ncbi:MAG: hypothetical protein ABR910_18275 [Acidobacteriaceae bacterium]
MKDYRSNAGGIGEHLAEFLNGSMIGSLARIERAISNDTALTVREYSPKSVFLVQMV